MNSNALQIATSMNIIIGIIVLGWMTEWFIAITFLVVIFAFIRLYRSWVLKHFGGVTGDILGASVELTEVILWLTLLLLFS